MSDTMSIIVTKAQAERLLALVDQENAAQKNRCASYLANSVPFGNDTPNAEAVERAIAAALDTEFLTTLRANIVHRLNNTLAR
jgi:hypothetical protein